MRYLRDILLAGMLIVTFSGCVYRIDVPQGNRIDAEVIEQLELGMSRNQVEFLLGSPAIIDPYHPDIWHYIYYLKTGRDGVVDQRHMTLTFTNDLLATVEGADYLN